MLGVLESLLLSMSLLLALYYYLTSTYDYWESRGVKGPRPVLIFGTFKEVITRKLSMGSYVSKIYSKFVDESFVGIFVCRSPSLILRDLDVIRDVLIKDFSKFPNRGSYINEKIEPLQAHLVHLTLSKWMPLRSRLTPTFTSSKLKNMFYLLVECAEQLENYLKAKIDRGRENEEVVLECRELTAKYTTDVVGACIFGLKLNAIADEDSPFRVMGRRAFTSWKKLTLFRLRSTVPWMYDLIGPMFANRDIDDFFISLTRDTMAERKEKGIVKHDFIDLLMGVRDNPEKMADIELTESLLAAQLYVFFVAGFETSSSTISNALYELAINQEIQEKLRCEIKEEINRTGGVVEYDGILAMKYLDMVFKETLRKHPVATTLVRESVEDYVIGGSSKNKMLTIKKGQKVWIPVYAIHHDSKYYPEPEIFDPERFTEEAVRSRHPMAYLPFGEGPRFCIGKRFAVLQTKVGIIKLLQRFRVEVCEKTQVPYEIDQKALLLAPKHGTYLKFVKDDFDTHQNLLT